jgi:hypothetical protein
MADSDKGRAEKVAKTRQGNDITNIDLHEAAFLACLLATDVEAEHATKAQRFANLCSMPGFFGLLAELLGKKGVTLGRNGQPQFTDALALACKTFPALTDVDVGALFASKTARLTVETVIEQFKEEINIVASNEQKKKKWIALSEVIASNVHIDPAPIP